MGIVECLKIVFLSTVIFLVPGYCLKYLLFKKEKFDPIESISVAFGLSLVYLCVPLVLFYFFRLPLVNCLNILLSLVFFSLPCMCCFRRS